MSPVHPSRQNDAADPPSQRDCLASSRKRCTLYIVRTTNPSPQKRLLNPFRVSTPRTERKLMEERRMVPIGSRRRRAAMTSTSNIPFTELPYQCFQEARAYLRQDREEKLQQIQVRRERIQRLEASTVAPQDEAKKAKRLQDMRRKLDELKILADINDPVVKKNFEDGHGDMNKPIYRYLADRKWREYKRKLLVQRITQMHVVPDVVPVLDPIYATSLSFGSKKVQHGDFVLSALSEQAPKLQIQPFNKGKRLISIAIVNSDVPDVEKDGFNYRCHFLAINIELSPTETRVELDKLDAETQVIQPWLPAYAQKGAPYQRMSIFVLEQPGSDAASQMLDMATIKAAKKYTRRENFILLSFMDRLRLQPVGVDLFRTQWDEGTAGVMQRAGVEGWNVEFKRKKVEPLPYQRKSGGRYR